MSHIKVLIKDHPHRSIALATSETALIFRHSPTSTDLNASNTSLTNPTEVPRCIVEFSSRSEAQLQDYRSLSSLSVHGTLGLITVQSAQGSNDVFLCVVSGATKVATVRPNETVQRILSVDFHCLSSDRYDVLLNEDINPYPTDGVGEDGFEYGSGGGRRQDVLEHPCLALKKLLSGGTFYYSSEFDLTRRLQDRFSDDATVALDSLDAGLLWNSFMIQPLVDFRSRLSQREKEALDHSKILTSAIRGFVNTIHIPASSSPARTSRTGLPSSLTLISRLSSRRAGTRFNSRGIDDDGNVANFVESETIFWSPEGLCFSYVQVRGSVPVFWEQQTGLLPGQQKITLTRSSEATQPAFDKHFEGLEYCYGAVHVVNLLSNEKNGETELSNRYHYHISHSSLNSEKDKEGHQLLRETAYDFHAETRGPGGYEAASMIRRWIQNSADGFAYWLSEEVADENQHRAVPVLQQEGVFRTNCLDCLDRTNLIQTIVSQMALEAFLEHRGERASSGFWVQHGSLWADNGDALSRIYAGTGALKSSFTRTGKMSFAGALADARKSATRMYINNFADKGRQNTIDMLLGRLTGQVPVHLYDPINDYVQSELNKKMSEFSSSDTIHIWVGTFNLNGRTDGIDSNLSPWLCPDVDPSQQNPELVVVGFQEIVELSPQQIMATDPNRRQAWEEAVKSTLNRNAKKRGADEYVLVRAGQLVGASMSIFAKGSVLKYIRNVEGSVKKTGMSGMAGNKGGVAIRMDFANTSICFVTAHLAAGFANYEERNRDYRTISHGLRFQRNLGIEDHDSVIWLGDFNYRIGLGNDKVRRFCELGDLETLYANDQLNIQMMKALTFPHYNEAQITFKPTYRFDIGTDDYDTSEKQRIPAWCDRILYKGYNLRQIHYNSAPLMFSDHRPVYATFRCTITVVDEKKRDQLSNELYHRRRAVVGGDTANTNAEDTDDEDLIGYEAVEPGLPPASSDRRKWWLDNGLPARSTIKPPSANHVPNPRRPSNPFTPSREPDWIEVKEAKNFPPHPEGRLTQLDGSSDLSVNRTLTQRRALPPPLIPDASKPILPSRTLSQNSTNSMTSIATRSSAARKAAPPVPKKPDMLVTSNPASPIVESQAPILPPPRRAATTLTKSPPVNTSNVSLPSFNRTNSSSSMRVLKKPLPPPVMSGRGNGPYAKGHSNGTNGHLIDDSDAGPPLPPRRPTANVMDDDGEMEGLRDWEVLRPGGASG